MAQYYSLAYIMKTTEEVQPTFSYTPGNTGDVMLAKGPNGGYIRNDNINFDISDNILGVTGQVRTDRVIFDNNNVRLGNNSGLTNQSGNAIAIGVSAGETSQGTDAIAIGSSAGLTDQSGNAIAIGVSAGKTSQGLDAIAIGSSAGLTDQSGNAIAIGVSAGRTSQGLDAIAIGYRAGETSQSDNTIILNATGNALNSVGDASGCYIKPIRDVNNNSDPYQSIGYNSTTGEIVSGTNFGFKLITDNFSVTGGGGRKGEGNDNLFAYSYDGVHWEQDETGSSTAARTFADGSCNTLEYDGTIWLAGGVGETAIVHSANGITWERNEDNMRFVLDSGNWRSPVDISGISNDGTEDNAVEFGSSIRLDRSGNLMAVGASSYDASAGIIHIFDYSMNSDTWVNTVDISGSGSGERYGSAVAIGKLSNGVTTRIAVGAPNFNTNDGKVYVFDTSSNENTWGDRAVYHNLSISRVDAGEKFGSALAMNTSGTRLLVGAPENNSNTGAAYSYDFSLNGDVWLRNNSDEFLKNNANGKFGFSIAMNSEGTRCLIGEPDNGTGRVYGYDLSGQSGYWGLTTTGATAVADDDLSYNPAVCDDSFGHAITMNDAGDWCAVGAPNSGSGRGWVGIYANNYRQWGLYTDISGETVGDEFGTSVSMNGAGDRLIVGAKGYGSGSGSGTNYVYNYNSETLAWEYERDISSNSTISNQGETLAIDTTGNRFVSGAPSDNTNKGAIVVYDRQMKCNALIKQSGNWIGAGNKKEGLFFSNDGISDWKKNDLLNNTSYFDYLYNSLSFKTFVNESNTLNSYGLTTGAQFGNSVSLNASGTIMAVGARLNDTNNGAVVLFQWNGSAWTQMGATLYGDTATYGLGTGSQFGWSVALNASGTILAVGAPSYSSNSGAAVLFQWNGSSWTQMGSTLFYDDYGLTTTAQFGYSVSLNASGTILAVGALVNDTGSTDNGAAVLFQWNGSSWTQMGATLYGDATYGLGTTAQFGVSIALNASGTILAVGANRYSGYDGAVVLFQWNGSSSAWDQMGSTLFYNNYGLTTTAEFGNSVALNASGTILAVGARYNDTGSANNGAAVLFQWNGSSAWTQMGATLYGDATYGLGTTSRFGWSVALNASGTILAVGANNYSSLSGAVVLFQWNGSSSAWVQMGWTLFYDDYGLTTTAELGFSVALNASGTILAVGAVVNNTGSADNGAVVLFTTEQFNYENNGLIEYNTIIRDTTSTTSSNTLLLGGEGTTDIINISSFQSSDGSTISLKNVDDFGVFSNDLSAKSISSTMTLYNMFPSYGLTTTAEFGQSVALNASGTIMAVGAMHDDTGSTNTGAVVLFQWNGSSWTQMGATLYGDDTYGQFGWSVALNASGTILAVGAQNNNTENGAAVLFQWNGSSSAWTQMGATLYGDATYGLGTGSYFGTSVALNASGTILAVGAPLDDTGSTDNGAAVLFQWNGSSWTQMGATLYGGTATYGLGTTANFGYSVALNASGTILAVGARKYSSSSGAVVLFQWNGSSAWAQMGSTLFYDDYGLTTTAQFGYSVSLNASGTILAVGALVNDTGSTDNGAVVLFQWNGSSAWTQMGATLYGDATYGLDTASLFGASVALNASGTILAVGARNYYSAAASTDGAVVLFQWNGSSSAWDQMGSTLFYDDYGITTTAQFGYSVALNASGTILAVGAPNNNTGSADNGAVVTFKIDHTANRYCNAIASNKNIIIAAGGPTEYSSTLVYSINQGETWNDIDNGSSTFPFSGKICNSVAWNGSRWVAGGRGANPLAYSYNGKKWYQSMNAGTLLGAASTCNAVSWNGKYWLASVEGDSVGGGQTQVYSNDGMAWIASNNGDTLFSGTSQALALATVKTGGAGAGDSITNLQSDVATLQAQQIGYNSNLYNVLVSKPRGVYYRNNTSKTIIVYGSVSYNYHALLKNPSGTVFEILNAGASSSYYNNLTFFVPPGWEYYLPSGGVDTRNRLHEFY